MPGESGPAEMGKRKHIPAEEKYRKKECDIIQGLLRRKQDTGSGPSSSGLGRFPRS